MLNFPDTPTLNQTFNGPSGIVWQWDGIKWLNSTLAKANVDAALQNVGRNKIHNSMFNIQQRGIGPWTLMGNYTADRWLMGITGGTMSVTLNAIPDAGRTIIGDDAATTFVGVVFVGGSAAGDVTYFEQRIENVRRLGGQTVTLSFWATANTGAPKLGLNLFQVFGTGGSPSAVVSGTATSVTLSQTWTRYTATFVMPTVIGKILGTNNDHSTFMRFCLSSGSNNNVAFGSIGVQSNTFNFWGVQLEIGTIVTPLEKLDPIMQLQQCQRFYQVGFVQLGGPATAGVTNTYQYMLPTPMRAAPVATPGTPISNVNAASPAINITNMGVTFTCVPTSTAGMLYSNSWTASADL